MNMIGSLLIWLGDVVRAGGHVVLDCFVWVWSGIDACLQPIMSPVLSVLNPLCTTIGDGIYFLLRPFPVWVGLTIVSIVVGLAMLVAFRYTSNQTAIGRAKDDIKANLLALKLYKDELAVTFQAQWRLLGAILRLQRYVLTPVLIFLLPMLLVLAQMGVRYQWRPLRPGEQTLITVTFDPGADHRAENASVAPTADRAGSIPPPVILLPHAGIDIEVDGIPGDNKIVWRVRGVEEGRHILHFKTDRALLEKELLIGSRFRRVGAIRSAADWTTQLLHPVEPRLPTQSGITSIEIAYPGADSWFHGPDWWILSFFVISMLTAIIFKPVFKVTF